MNMSGKIYVYVRSEVSTSLHRLKGIFGQRGEAELYNLLKGVKRYLRVAYTILPNTTPYRVCHSLEQ